jgi:hypothetical protein
VRCEVKGCPFRSPCPDHDQAETVGRDPWAGLADRIAGGIPDEDQRAADAAAQAWRTRSARAAAATRLRRRAEREGR